MSIGYVIPEVSREQILDTLEEDDNIIVRDEGNDFLIQMPIEEGYAFRKRMHHAKATGLPPDNVQQGTNQATIRLMKAPDEHNSWFWGTSVSISHPEMILNRIIELLNVYGVDATFLSENDEGYWDYA